MVRLLLASLLMLPFVSGVAWPQTNSAPFAPKPISREAMESNKKAALAFYNAAINKKDFEEASKYMGPYYKQHNPLVADGREGFKAFLAFLRKEFPQAHSEVLRVFADGDYVILHVRSYRRPNTRGRAIFELLKFENGKVVEHWDAIQEVPEKSENPNGMF